MVLKLRQKKVLTAYMFLSLPLAFFIFIRFYPMIYAFYISFTNWNIISPVKKFVGIENYVKIFQDEVFRISLFNTLKYVILGVPVVIILSLGLALLLNNITKFQSLYRLVYVIPYITPLVAVSWVWRWMYQRPPIGVINNFLSAIGLPTGTFLSDTAQALPSIVATTVWVELGYCVIIFLAGLQTIPKEYIEAARIDGANRRQVLVRITIPLLNPVIVFLTVMETIIFLRIFTQVYNMTDQGSGGPLNSTKPLVLYIYQKAFKSFEMGTASAATTILFLIILGITVLQLRVLNKKVQY
ncbi:MULTISPECIES: carbohydrate ABC transporter permease [Pseudothermotoga]|uniref:carbohydrate ABC transporter permease n=1 Tax=Pseudothermotoga TaxID=1643951 RepID=UPI00048ED7C1|nr:sugar ABC transporter permease [Pseudothermotoga sp.]HBT25333.1 sugar ABC transporter permease [Pseudothermotoga sp.]